MRIILFLLEQIKRFTRRYVNWMKLFIWSSYLVLLVLAGASAYCYYLSRSLPLLSSVVQPQYELPSNVYDIHGTLVDQFSIKRRVLVKYDEIPKIMIDALISIEDSRFFDHFGIDVIRILKAVVIDSIHMSFVQGASTLTQQTAKMFFLSSEKKITRKVKEILLALKMENQLTKQQILELYLNKTYFGNNSYGIEAAAQSYFHKHTKDITLTEAALLAGLPQAPSRWAPTYSKKLAKKRRNTVLAAMLHNDKITEQQYKQAIAMPIILSNIDNSQNEAAYFVEYVRKKLIKKYGMHTLYKGGLRIYTTMDLSKQIEANHALTKGLIAYDRRHGYRKSMGNLWQIVSDKLNLDFYSDKQKVFKKNWEKLSEDLKKKSQNLYIKLETKNLKRNNFVLQTTVTAVIENVTKKELSLLIGRYKAKINLYTSRWAKKPDDFRRLHDFTKMFQRGDLIKAKLIDYDQENKIFLATLEQKPDVNGSLFAVDSNTGNVVAMVGGYEFKDSEFNRAIQSYRQTGSSFKPFVYSYAFDNNFTRMSLLDNTPIVFHETNWKPQNYAKRFSGPVFLKDALAHSRNIPTIHLGMRLKISKLIPYVHTFGITSKLPNDLTLTLGSASVPLAEMVQAYSVFDNGGTKYPLRYLLRIEDSNKKVLWKAPPLQGTHVISEGTSFLVTRTLRDVINQGTGRRAKVLQRPIAGKTGTTNNFTDAWFIGYTPNIVSGVYVGFDNQQHSLGDKEEGARAALPIWISFMQHAMKTMPILPFHQPSDITAIKIDAKTGLLPCGSSKKTILEYFKIGTEPTECVTEEASPETFTNTDVL